MESVAKKALWCLAPSSANDDLPDKSCALKLQQSLPFLALTDLKEWIVQGPRQLPDLSLSNFIWMTQQVFRGARRLLDVTRIREYMEISVNISN